ANCRGSNDGPKTVLRHLRTVFGPSLDPLQFAYQPQIAVEDAITFLLHRAYTHLEEAGSTVRVMFFDFSSAFNTIQPALLNRKLLDMQVDSPLTAWIKNYLTVRPQYVRLENITSDTTVSSTGVPQGTVLSCLPSTPQTSGSVPSPATCRSSRMTLPSWAVSAEARRRSVVDRFVEWCGLNQLQLNVTNGPFPLAPTQLDSPRLDSGKEMNIKKHLCWKLKRAGLSPQLLTNFYRATTESILCLSAAVWCSEPGQADMVSLIRTPEQPRVCPFLWVHTVLVTAVMLTFTHLSDMIDRLLKYHRILGTQSSFNYELKPVEFYNVNTINQSDAIPDTEINSKGENLRGVYCISEKDLSQRKENQKRKENEKYASNETYKAKDEAELCDPTLPDENDNDDDDVDENMEDKDNDYDEDDLMDIDRFESNALYEAVNEPQNDDMLLCDEQPQEQIDDPEQEEWSFSTEEAHTFTVSYGWKVHQCLRKPVIRLCVILCPNKSQHSYLTHINNLNCTRREKNLISLQYHQISSHITGEISQFYEQFYGTLLKLYVPYRSDQELKRGSIYPHMSPSTKLAWLNYQVQEHP
ncbi:hypothetical protein L3Q82_020932, partial [Scortum barcoo]